jgi:PiT family inorganic phosphate transporter
MLSQQFLLWVAGFVGLYMAWNIGANDVANAMGTSVGSKALTMRQAVVLAGILEFLGAVLVGAYVTNTVRKGIVDPTIFTADPVLLAYGMTAALAAAAIWLNIATLLGWPVSTTHSIIGAIAGFGIVVGGSGAISWGTLGAVVASWVVSPFTGGLFGYFVYMFIRKRVIEKQDQGRAARENAPLMVAGMLFVLTLAMLFKGLKNLKLKLTWWHSGGLAVAAAICGNLLVKLFQRGGKDRPSRPEDMEIVFRYLQIASAAFVAFAHGANDVANAVGPLAAVFSIIGSGTVVQKVQVPIWILLIGGVGIVVGLATYGYKVIGTVGSKITEVTPSRGFAAEIGAAITILVGSKLGLPLSTTHTLVGAVVGVGFARGMNALNLKVIRNIITSWFLTLPFAAGVCIAIFYLLKAIFSS